MNRYASHRTLTAGVLLLVLFYIFTDSISWLTDFTRLFCCALAVVHALFALGVAHDAATRRAANTQLYSSLGLIPRRLRRLLVCRR